MKKSLAQRIAESMVPLTDEKILYSEDEAVTGEYLRYTWNLGVAVSHYKDQYRLRLRITKRSKGYSKSELMLFPFSNTKPTELEEAINRLAKVTAQPTGPEPDSRGFFDKLLDTIFFMKVLRDINPAIPPFEGFKGLARVYKQGSGRDVYFHMWYPKSHGGRHQIVVIPLQFWDPMVDAIRKAKRELESR